MRRLVGAPDFTPFVAPVLEASFRECYPWNARQPLSVLEAVLKIPSLVVSSSLSRTLALPNSRKISGYA